MRAANDDPQAPDTGSRHHIGLWSWFMLFSLLVPFYILSTGPMAKLFQRGVIPEPVMRMYAPVDFLYRNFPPATRFLDWYVEDVWHAK